MVRRLRLRHRRVQRREPVTRSSTRRETSTSEKIGCVRGPCCWKRCWARTPQEIVGWKKTARGGLGRGETARGGRGGGTEEIVPSPKEVGLLGTTRKTPEITETVGSCRRASMARLCATLKKMNRELDEPRWPFGPRCGHRGKNVAIDLQESDAMQSGLKIIGPSSQIIGLKIIGLKIIGLKIIGLKIIGPCNAVRISLCRYLISDLSYAVVYVAFDVTPPRGVPPLNLSPRSAGTESSSTNQERCNNSCCHERKKVEIDLRCARRTIASKQAGLNETHQEA